MDPSFGDLAGFVGATFGDRAQVGLLHAGRLSLDQVSFGRAPQFEVSEHLGLDGARFLHGGTIRVAWAVRRPSLPRRRTVGRYAARIAVAGGDPTSEGGRPGDRGAPVAGGDEVAGAGMRRLLALADGLFAIALTLLVIEIALPEDTSDARLGAALVALLRPTC